MSCWGNSLEVQWLGLQAFIGESPGSVPFQLTKIPQDACCGQKKGPAGIFIRIVLDLYINLRGINIFNIIIFIFII